MDQPIWDIKFYWEPYQGKYWVSYYSIGLVPNLQQNWVNKVAEFRLKAFKIAWRPVSRGFGLRTFLKCDCGTIAVFSPFSWRTLILMPLETTEGNKCGQLKTGSKFGLFFLHQFWLWPYRKSDIWSFKMSRSSVKTSV